MPRPKDKPTLITLTNENYQLIVNLIEGLPDSALHTNYSFEHRDKNVRDTLAHLHHWHLMFLNWYEVGMDGGKPDMPAKGFTFRETPALNQWIWEQYQNVSLTDIKKRFCESHQQCLSVSKFHSEKELFTKRVFPWTGSTSLASYLISATSSHYDWALKWLRKHQKVFIN